MHSTDVTLYYVHDPMCSWCYGFRPAWERIESALGSSVKIEYVLGGLAADTDQPMPGAMREKLEATWHKIQDKLGAEFNFDFWRTASPRRATYPACRAVIAAQYQGQGKEMIRAIQNAYYQRAMNPSDSAVLQQLAEELSSLEYAARSSPFDAERFSRDFLSEQTQAELLRQIDFSRSLGAMGFPSLVLRTASDHHLVHYDYLDPAVTIKQVEKYITVDEPG